MYCMYMHVYLRDLSVDIYTIHAYTYNRYIYIHTYIYIQIHAYTYDTYVYLRTYKYVHWKNVSIEQYICVNTYKYQFHFPNTYEYVQHGSLMYDTQNSIILYGTQYLGNCVPAKSRSVPPAHAGADVCMYLSKNTAIH